MKKILPHLPTILIIVALVMAYFAFNQLLTNNGELKAELKATSDQIKEMNQKHQEENKVLESLKMIVLKQDTLIINQNEKIDYLRKQNDAIFNRYNNISVKLPAL